MNDKKEDDQSDDPESKTDYYRKTRSEMVRRILRNLESPKKPAITGTIVVTPIIVTLFIISWLFDKLNSVPGNKFFNITQNFYFNQLVKLVVLLILITVIVTGIGRFVRTKTGFQLEKLFDTFMDKIPLLGSVYNITKVTTDTIMTGPEGFKEPAKIDVNGLRLTAFRTGNKTEDGRHIVFMPTSPNITTGFVIEADPERLLDSNETAEDALTRVLSAGFGSSNKKKDD